MNQEFSQWNKSVPDYDALQQSVIDSIDFPEEQNLKCVELGVGKGGTAYYLFEKFKDLKYTGVDSYEESLKYCEESFKDKKGCDFVLSTVEDYIFPSDLDCVISVLTVHHLRADDKVTLYKKVFEALRPGGLFVIGDIFKNENPEIEMQNKQSRSDFRDSVLNEEEKMSVKEHIQNYPHIFESLKDTEEALLGAGFKDFNISWSNYGMSVVSVRK